MNPQFGVAVKGTTVVVGSGDQVFELVELGERYALDVSEVDDDFRKLPRLALDDAGLDDEGLLVSVQGTNRYLISVVLQKRSMCIW